MGRQCLLSFLLLCGCSGQNDGKKLQVDSPNVVLDSEWDSLPVGFEVKHAPNPVLNPEGPLKGDWPFKWSFQTAVRAIDRPLTVRKLYILGWDGNRWVLDPKQEKFNSGELDQKTFADWYSCPDGKITPDTPASDPTNWAGSYERQPFKQKWVVIGEDTEGKAFKGVGIVELLIE